MVELFASTGTGFDSSIKFNAPTCEDYCECEAAVGSLLRIEAFLSNNSLLRKKSP